MYNFVRKRIVITKLYVEHYRRRNSFLAKTRKLKRQYRVSSIGHSISLSESSTGVNNSSAVTEFFSSHKKAFLIFFFSLIILFLAFVTAYNNLVVFEYSYKGQVLGVVRDQEEVYSVVAKAEDQLSAPNGAKIIIDNENDIKVKRILSIGPNKKELDTESDIINNIVNYGEVQVLGYSVVVNGNSLGILRSEDEGNLLLERVKEYYLAGTEEKQYKRIDFVENVTYEETATTPKEILSVDTIYDEIVEGAIQLGTYEVHDGDTSFDIAMKFDMKTERLEELNPVIDMDLIQEGDILQIEEQKALISLETVEVEEYEADVDFEIETYETPKLYSDQEEEKVAGENGTRLVIADVVRVNGLEIDRHESTSKIIKEPVNKVVYVGTVPRPVAVSKGNLIWPTKTKRVTSTFGQRWGRLHKGLDIGIRYGSVYAADGGTVTIAGNQNAYGKAIKIDHGNGKATFYAHLSEIDVKVGQKVAQGERIAKSGNTGRSTGPHLHFEVHINGVQKNPMDYLKD